MKQKKCRCGTQYTQYTTLQNKCIKCLAVQEKRKRERAEAKKKKEQGREHRARKQKLNDSNKKYQLKKAQPAFNKFIRLRDKDEDCISCGRTNAEVEVTDGWKIGGAWDCGHYLAVGSHPELRFEELNAYKQCKSCNGGSGQFTKKSYTVGKEYRERLIKRKGIEVVDWLEGPHELKHWTAEELKEKAKYYNAKARQLEKGGSV